MVICRPYTVDAKVSWDLFVDSCKSPLFFFKRDYLEYHADRFADASLMFYLDDVLVAIFPASTQNDVLNSHGGLTYGGLLLLNKIRAESVCDIVSCLAKKARELGFKKIVYKAIPYLFYTHGAQEDLYFIANTLDAKIVRRDLSSVIYLDNRIKLSKGKKWLIARAKKLGLEIGNSTAWASFHSLLSQVLVRHRASPVHSIKELEYLSSLFPDNIYLKTVEKNGVLLAAALLFKFQTTVHTQYLVTNEEGKASGALDFLIETCIEESKQQEFKYFSFGASTEQQGTILNTSLIAQKENFGARGIVLDFYEIELK
ncbi:hypothetical protein [Legionella sp.]|uniref:hypothetical protein n=1 Tax=Legionella sp. TaxID=459 RepID=UPI003C827C82